MDKITNVSIGSDVEFFLQDRNTKEIISAENIIMGTKENPFHFDSSNHFYATSLDNVMAEGNIPPAKNAVEFYNNVETLIKYIASSIPKELELKAIPSARLNERWLMTDTARTFGCDPSNNCWTLQEVKPEPKGDNVRCAGK